MYFRFLNFVKKNGFETNDCGPYILFITFEFYPSPSILSFIKKEKINVF